MFGLGLLDNRVGLLVSSVFRWLPGEFGQRKDTEYYRLLRSLRPRDVEQRFQACVRRLGPQHTVIDLGANLGAITTRLAQTGARVIAFEPDPWAFEKLTAAVADMDNVAIYNAAVGPKDGQAEFKRDPGFSNNRESRSAGNGLYESVLWENGEVETFSVSLVDFVRFLEDLDCQIELVKMDIEGAEVDVLEKLIESKVFTRIQHLFVETHEWQIPEIRSRLVVLRKRLSRVSHPNIYLDWQ